MLTSFELLSKYNIPVTPRVDAVVMDAFPSGLKMLLKNTCPQLHLYLLDPADTEVGRICFSLSPKNNNHYVQALL